MTTFSVAHEMLVANAGSGKTHRLTLRTITLLGHGVEPEKIAALTFTKKAAGEFLEAVFRRLARAADDPGALASLRSETGLGDLDETRCREILRRLAHQMHRLSMGTIDSLFGRIARSFPLESGLQGDFTLLEEAGLSRLRRDVLAELFRSGVSDPEKFQEFLDVVRRQSRRESERSVFTTLLNTTARLHESFLRTPAHTFWGDPDLIWPDGCAILRAGDHRAAADSLWDAIVATHPDLSEAAQEAWRTNLERLKTLRRGQVWPRAVVDFIKGRLVKFSVDKKTGRHYVPTGNAAAGRVYLNEAVEPARRALVLALFKLEVEALLGQSAALYRLMARFEEIYGRSVRAQGFLTFSDVTQILAAQVDDPAWRAAVGYRLDGRFDHWLLDEFQDTSRPQWQVLRAFIDEVIQDPGGDRSFFYVGDTKQAIYSWRGGDPSLFFEIQDYYNRAGECRIRSAEPLSVSFRSDPEIIEVVNQVFEGLPAELSLPSEAVAKWQKAWVRHSVAERNAGNRGYVYWKPVDEADQTDDEEAGPQDSEVLRILLEIRPWERGWSCAALKRDNQKVEALAALLQAHGVPVTVEGKANPCADNVLGVTLQAVFRWVASPDDKLSKVFLLSGPLSEVVSSSVPDRLRERTLQAIAERGFAEATRLWLSFLDLNGEPFLSQRAEDFLAAAGQFDVRRQPSDGISEFLHYLETYERQEPEGTGRVRIMTIHQAKGLTLDMVVVSGLDTLVKDRSTGSLTLGTNAKGQTWGMILPRAEIAETDETLKAARDHLLTETAYGELCAAYVAMTRAKHGLYLVTNKLGENSKAKGFARLLGLQLGQVEPFFEKGDPKWFERNPETEECGPLLADRRPVLPKPLSATPHAVSPSRTGDTGHPQKSLRSPEGASLGTEIHRVLAGIAWDPKAAGMEALPEGIRERVERFLGSFAAKRLFTPPAGPHHLWREQAFDLILDGRWVSGVFDRVHILTGAEGRPTAAAIYDFKTDQAEEGQLREKYRDQLEVYRSAAAQLLGLPPAAVTADIVVIA